MSTIGGATVSASKISGARMEERIIRNHARNCAAEFGKMIKLQEAENQIVIEYEVYDRRPNDSDLLVPAIETHQATFGRVPHLVAADAAFYSGKNEAAAKAKRVNKLLNQEPRTQTRAEETLVPQRPEMAHRLRGPHQRREAGGMVSAAADIGAWLGLG
jgi:hypothetical protein